jgi:DEAD/DEAH box helicase domain-containing protein
MDVWALLARLQHSRHYRGQIAAARTLEPREARYAEPQRRLAAGVRQWLQEAGVEQLYAHQAAACDAILAGQNVVLATGTASGKSLCYQVPMLETLLADPDSRVLYLAPAKALAQDQLATLERLISLSGLGERVKAACYDGDTVQSKRSRIRRTANIVLSNPDMLHVSVLPYHAKWAQFLSRLQYVIIDEVHSYRGIFGSHVANVLWRLQRLCAHYGSNPQYICCSATLGNPRALAETLTARPMALIDEDASPQGRKHIVLWNPPWLEGAKIGRRSTNVEAQELMQACLEAGAGTITFTKARVVTELIYKFVTESLGRRRPELAAKIKPYRGGYLPNERREIEQGLFSGRLKGVCTTTALELGIDVGALDAAIIVGFPRTFCSLWQQVGRAGRRQAESVAFLVAYDDPIDQFLMRHGEFVFDQPLEHAIVDPHNPHILAKQLACAAFELPLQTEELTTTSDIIADVVDVLSEEGTLRETGGAHYYAASDFPAAQTDLRSISDANYSILDQTAGRNVVIGQVDAISAPELVYPEAIYLHQAESFIVRELDQELRVARVERFEADYYTQPVLADECKIIQERYQDAAAGGRRFFGDLRVQWQTIAFRKFKYYTQELIGLTKLHLDPLAINTTGCWLQAPPGALEAVADAGFKVSEALSGVRNLLMVALPPLAMCDRFDIGGIVESSQLGVATIFIYDRYEGGLGYARHAYEAFDAVLGLAGRLVAECPCEEGCPACVAPPNLHVPIQHDPDVYRGYEIPKKQATRIVLDQWCHAFAPAARTAVLG